MTKSVTDSLKVTVIGIGDVFVGSAAVEAIVTVGATASTVIEFALAIFPSTLDERNIPRSLS